MVTLPVAFYHHFSVRFLLNNALKCTSDAIQSDLIPFFKLVITRNESTLQNFQHSKCKSNTAKLISCKHQTGIVLSNGKIFYLHCANSHKDRSGFIDRLDISLANIYVYVMKKEIEIWIGEFISYYLPLCYWTTWNISDIHLEFKRR